MCRAADRSSGKLADERLRRGAEGVVAMNGDSVQNDDGREHSKNREFLMPLQLVAVLAWRPGPLHGHIQARKQQEVQKKQRSRYEFGVEQ